jgi:hypothetical protein
VRRRSPSGSFFFVLLCVVTGFRIITIVYAGAPVKTSVKSVSALPSGFDRQICCTCLRTFCLQRVALDCALLSGSTCVTLFSASSIPLTYSARLSQKNISNSKVKDSTCHIPKSRRIKTSFFDPFDRQTGARAYEAPCTRLSDSENTHRRQQDRHCDHYQHHGSRDKAEASGPGSERHRFHSIFGRTHEPAKVRENDWVSAWCSVR